MKPHELRLAQEHARTSAHLRNLRLFINDASRFSLLDPKQQSLMRQQAEVLADYVDILRQRLTLLKIPV